MCTDVSDESAASIFRADDSVPATTMVTRYDVTSGPE